MEILSIGTIGFDIIETPFGKTNKILGGAATFAGFSASILEVPIHLVSVVGKDFPKSYLKLFESKNINTEAITIIPNEKTFFWYGKYNKDMNSRDTIVTELNVIKNFKPKIPESLKNIEVILLGNLHPSIQLSVLKQVKNFKLVILDTMNFWIHYTWDLLIEVIKKTYIIIINDSESRQISGEYNLIKAAKKIYTMGPKFIIIKKGEHGALFFTKDKIFVTPAFPIEEVCDPTGAGDTFIGGFAAYLAKKNDLSFESMKNAIIYGSTLASFCVEKFGTERIQKVTKNELDIRLKKFKLLTNFNF